MTTVRDLTYPLCSFALLALFAASAVAQELRPVDLVDVEREDRLQDKIIDGQPAPPGKYPFQVALVASHTPVNFEAFGQFCGGTLIDELWVLTAAHCVLNTEPEEIDVYIGAQELPTGGAPTGERVPLVRIISHQGFDAGTYDNDIAMLKLASATGIATTRPSTQDEFATASSDASDLTVIGWGLTDENAAQGVPLLHEVDVEFQSDKLCHKNYAAAFLNIPGADGEVTKNMFCAGRIEGGKDSCQGDSGGFIGRQGSAGDWQQFGVVSWGLGCAQPGLFGVYTKVSNYGEWIQRVMDAF